MKRTSVRTLVLLVELFAVAMAYQLIAWVPSTTAAMTWLDDDPNEVVDPNETVDPNSGSTLPESIGVASRIWLDDESEDPNDPNAPDAQETPLPEAAVAVPAAWGL